MRGATERDRGLARLGSAVRQAMRLERPLAALRLDVDGIAAIARTRGEEAARTARAACEARLQRAAREGDAICTVSGDGYLAVLALTKDERELAGATRRFIETVRETDPLLRASVGVAVFPEDGFDPRDLFAKAEAAATAAATAGGGTAWFREGAGRAVGARDALRAKLAVPNETLLRVDFEPIVDARELRPVAARAILAWRDPELRGSPYDVFDPPGDADAVAALDAWTLERAISLADRWPAAGLELRLHVGLRTTTERIVALCGNTHGVCIELAEEAIAHDVDAARVLAGRLRRLGVAIGAEAFSGSRASLDALAAIPLDVLAVDVRGDLRALAALAAASILAPRIIGAGLADRERIRNLARQGVGTLRGPGIAPALTAERFVSWCRE